MTTHSPIHLRHFKPTDQDAAKALILSGLVDHFGTLSPNLNPDLNDISESYADAVFIVAELEGQIIGTGALKPDDAETGGIVRMSVASELRRKGIGFMILERICVEGRVLGYRRLILETTATWTDVIAFYLRFGFEVTHQIEGEFGPEIYLAMDL